MSDKKVKNNNNNKRPASNSLKALATKRRQVFKPVLDSPYNDEEIIWPTVEPSQNAGILKELASFLQKDSVKKCIEDAKDARITAGFNSTTKALEDQARILRHQKKTKKKNKKKEDNSIITKYIIICRYDIQPRMLLDHFPMLCYTSSPGFYDSDQQDGDGDSRRVKLVALSKNSKDFIGNQLNKSKDFSGIISMQTGMESLEKLVAMLESIPDIKIPWLDNIQMKEGLYQKPVLKLLKTSAPLSAKKNQR